MDLWEVILEDLLLLLFDAGVPGALEDLLLFFSEAGVPAPPAGLISHDKVCYIHHRKEFLFVRLQGIGLELVQTKQWIGN